MTTTTLPTASPESETRPARPAYWKWAVTGLAAVTAAGFAAAVYLGAVPPDRVRAAVNEVARATGLGGHPHAPAEPPAADEPVRPAGPWDGVISVSAEDQAAVGFGYSKVQAQTEPIVLELTGRTAYDTDTITKVRPRFDTRVERVFASIGWKIKKGDPLVELYSTDLAKAKTTYQTHYVQWQHDLNLYKLREKLAATGAISQQVWVDTQNEEQKSRLDFNIALDNLKVFYEVPAAEIDPLLKGLGDTAVEVRQYGTVGEKAKMTIRAKSDGIVISREVVPGNYYEATDVLMEIAPLDHLWVWVNVFELDQSKVTLGQSMVIQFPFMHQEIVGKVDFVSSEVSKETRAVRVRASIPNATATLKSEMLVKAMLEIPPVAGQTVIPRVSMVSLSGTDYVFVRKQGGPKDAAKPADRYERRLIEVAQENTDHVIVTRGLAPGEELVTSGSLILSQLYEDQRVTSTGRVPE